jgi:hypothetical protein
MTKEQIALARRAVACDKWQWVEGMELMLFCAGDPDEGRTDGIVSAGRILDVHNGYVSAWEFPQNKEGYPEYRTPYPDWIPNLDDPTTVAVLIHIVRQAHQRRYVSLCSVIKTSTKAQKFPVYGWIVRWQTANGAEEWESPWAHTEAEALIMALEAA